MIQRIKDHYSHVLVVALFNFIPIFNLVRAFRIGDSMLIASWFLTLCAFIALTILMLHMSRLFEALHSLKRSNDSLLDTCEQWKSAYGNLSKGYSRLSNHMVDRFGQECMDTLTRDGEQQPSWN